MRNFKLLLIVIACIFGLALPSYAAITDNLVACFSLDEVSGNRVSSNLTFTLTDTNTVTSNPGKISLAGQFTLANVEYLLGTDSTSFEPGSGSAEVWAWVYNDSEPAASSLTYGGKYVSSGNQREWRLYYATASDRFVFGGSADGIAVTDAVANTFGAVSTGTWYFLIGVFDNVGNTLGISVNNGTVDTVAFASNMFTGTAAFAIGSRADAIQSMDGRIDQFMYFNAVKSAADRTAGYNGGAGVDCNGASLGKGGLLLRGVGP